MKVLHCNTKTGKCILMYETLNPEVSVGFNHSIRESSQMVRIKSWYIGISHSFDTILERRYYEHSFYLCEPHPPFRLKHLSKSFTLPD